MIWAYGIDPLLPDFIVLKSKKQPKKRRKNFYTAEINVRKTDCFISIKLCKHSSQCLHSGAKYGVDEATQQLAFRGGRLRT